MLYARVSTTEQTIGHQRTQAEKAGFKIDAVVVDEGVSGVSTPLAERPEGRRLCDMLRAGDLLVVRWVDRLGRNYADVTDTIRDFMRAASSSTRWYSTAPRPIPFSKPSGTP